MSCKIIVQSEVRFYAFEGVIVGVCVGVSDGVMLGVMVGVTLLVGV
jgi:hypothetical protein